MINKWDSIKSFIFSEIGVVELTCEKVSQWKVKGKTVKFIRNNGEGWNIVLQERFHRELLKMNIVCEFCWV